MMPFWSIKKKKHCGGRYGVIPPKVGAVPHISSHTFTQLLRFSQTPRGSKGIPPKVGAVPGTTYFRVYIHNNYRDSLTKKLSYPESRGEEIPPKVGDMPGTTYFRAYIFT